MTISAWTDKTVLQLQQQLSSPLITEANQLKEYQEDFGHIVKTQVKAVYCANTIEELQSVVRFADQQRLPLTIRGTGHSQSGQALPLVDGLVIDMQAFNQVIQSSPTEITVAGNCKWQDVLATALKNNSLPLMFPNYNELTVAGTIAAGGCGPASFKYGFIGATVSQLELVQANGDLVTVNEDSPLFQACIAGQGQFAIITKATLKLRSAKDNIRTFICGYNDPQIFMDDLNNVGSVPSFIESLCTPAVVGSKIQGKMRKPFAKWQYVMHITVEWDKTPPQFEEHCSHLNINELLHIEDEPLNTYVNRYEMRFKGMQAMGQWELPHPWYECFMPESLLRQHLPEVLDGYPLFYPSPIHIIPIQSVKSGFFRMPTKQCYALAILVPGVHEFALPMFTDFIKHLDDLFLPKGGNRYLSGFLGNPLSEEYWQQHFGEQYNEWNKAKKQFDPNNVFVSKLHQEKG